MFEHSHVPDLKVSHRHRMSSGQFLKRAAVTPVIRVISCLLELAGDPFKHIAANASAVLSAIGGNGAFRSKDV